MDILLNWKLWMILVIIGILILWLFYGGDDHEFMGLGENDSDYEDEIEYEDSSSDINNMSDDESGGYRSRRYHSNSKVNLSNSKSNVKVPIPQLQNNAKNYKTEQKKPKRPLYKESKAEAITRRTLEEIYNKPFIQCRPDFLRNPETGENLELDCYNDELKIAAEYNGVQHYHWPNFTGQSEEQFFAQLKRDQYKVDVCDDNGIYLITIPHDVKYDDIPAYIEYYLPENMAKRLEQAKSNNYSKRYV